MTMQSKQLYRLPQEGVIRGVCAGLAHYFNIPVLLIRVIAVIALFAGFFGLTIIAYFVLSLFMEPAPANYQKDEDQQESLKEILSGVDNQLMQGEKRLQQMERYITSSTYQLNKRFRDL
ncbi:envelope stress response membrane protein PspC [Proteus faecis]|uniref:Envelope stress response membrane protein PspC n=1 Tax=Proteus faecis TaxID=2050967 RepID=A0ABZ3EFW0_9GAMM|nr:envelope stress response membrane protein PspC [Proteus faecis]MDM3869005.1 envelope stress response membrane protein PspC [Proteus faecis]